LDSQAIHRLSTSLLNLFFPPHCVGCQALGDWFCEGCQEQIRPVVPPLCQRCGRGLKAVGSQLCADCRSGHHAVEQIRSAVYSEGVLREAIHALKYDGITALVEPLASLMADYWSRCPMAVDVMVPVPLHRARQRRRGFNQAALLARGLSERTGIPVDEDILVRHRRTAAQVGLDADERTRNVRGAFRRVSAGAKGRAVLVIDDVCTTGSTLEACAVALQQGGVKSVKALTLARAR
jgi:ComF family protein